MDSSTTVPDLLPKKNDDTDYSSLEIPIRSGNGSQIVCFIVYNGLICNHSLCTHDRVRESRDKAGLKFCFIRVEAYVPVNLFFSHVGTFSCVEPVLIVFPPAPKKGMVKFSRKGHFQRVHKPASFIFSPVLSSFTFLSQFTNPLEAGCCYCQPFKQKNIEKNLLA